MTTFTDDFNRANSTNLGANWVEVSGDWSIISNQLSSGSAGGTVILRAATAMATSDHYAQITIAATAAVSHGVWCRGNSNISQGYLWRNDGTSWNLFSVVGGSFTSIGSYTAAAAAGDVAKIQAVGSTIKGYVNGIERVSVVNTAVTTGTSVGIRAESTSSLRFDDFSAEDVTTGATGDAALSGTATLSATGLRAAASSAALTTAATLTAAGLRATAGDTALTATAGLTASGQTSAVSDAGLAAAAALAATGQRGASVDAELAVTADLSSQGRVAYSGGAALTAEVTLTADGVTGTPPVVGAAALDATSTLTAVGDRRAVAGAALEAAAALTAAGTISVTGNAAIVVTATLTASGTTLSAHDDIDVTVGTPYSPWTAGKPHTTAWKVQEPQANDWEVGAPW